MTFGLGRLRTPLLAVLALAAATGCGQGVSGPASVGPETQGLAHTRLLALPPAALPTDAEAVQRLIDGLPENLGELTLKQRGRSSAEWAGTGNVSVSVTVQPLEQAATPEAEMVEFFPAFARNGGFELAEQKLDGQGLMFFTGADPATGGLIAAWASTGGRYLFGVEASSQELLDQGVGAMTQ